MQLEIGFVYLVLAIACLAVGSGLGYVARQSFAKKQLGSIETKLAKMAAQAKEQSINILAKAQDKAVKIIEQAKQEDQSRRQELLKREARLERREESLDHRLQEAEKQARDLEERINKVKAIKEELIGLRKDQRQKLEQIAGLNEAQAKKELLSLLEQEQKDVLLKRLEKLETNAKEQLEKKARDIVILAMQRYAASQASEVSATTVSLPSDDLKGRIIGKEGRNIKTLEKLTGVEVVVDDTPGAIVISAFDPIRRQIAKMALESLMQDGRIQPARIEEAVEKARENITEKVQEAGEAAVYDVGVVGLNPRLVHLLGRLRFRTSYGQNVLLHSLEVAHLAGAMAAEIGADVKVAKKAGLLHDIGKSVDHEIQGSHVEIGINILKKFETEPAVINAMKSHHEDYPYETTEAILIQTADAISGSRPGARKDTLEAYLKRLEDLEEIAASFAGVEKSYAIQAGREIRIFVKPEEIDDFSAKKLARDIAGRVEEELKYPGEIKVNVIRETRAIEYAR